MLYSYYKVGIDMRKVKLFVVVILVFFCCTACNGTITREIRHAGFTMSDTFICDNFFPKEKEDTNYERIKYFTGSHLINSEGKIYELSLGQKFANDQNCKISDTNLIVKAIFDNKIIKGTDNKYYYLVASNNVPSYSEIPQTDNSYLIYDLLLKDEGVIKVVTANSSTGLYYVLKEDGNIYGYTISKKDYNSLPTVTSTTIAYSKNDYGSRIVDFNYAGESLNTFIRTDEKIFRMRITNSEKCNKYADVKCNYKLEEDEIFNTYKDVIISYNGSTLITNYNQMFNVAYQEPEGFFFIDYISKPFTKEQTREKLDKIFSNNNLKYNPNIDRFAEVDAVVIGGDG